MKEGQLVSGKCMGSLQHTHTRPPSDIPGTLRVLQSAAAYSSLMESSTLELEKPHSFIGVTPDAAPTIFQGLSRNYKDLTFQTKAESFTQGPGGAKQGPI